MQWGYWPKSFLFESLIRKRTRIVQIAPIDESGPHKKQKRKSLFFKRAPGPRRAGLGGS